MRRRQVILGREGWSAIQSSELGLVLALGVWASWGASVVTNTGAYTIDIWQVDEGLPQISVTSIAQTPDGCLWAGTFNGLARFDGVRFRIFDAANTPALGSGRIIQLEVDQEGALWILTEAGSLARMAGGQFIMYRTEDGLPASGASVLARDFDGRLLLQARDGQLHRIEQRKLLPLEIKDGLRGPALLIDGRGPVWIASQGKAMRSSGQILPVPIAGSTNTAPMELSVDCAVRSRAGGHWLASAKAVYRLDKGLLQTRITSMPKPLSQLNFMAEDAEGNLWLAAMPEGLFRWEPNGQWEHFIAGAGLADNSINAIFCDREGNVWVGTTGGGLHRLKRRLFRMYDTRDGLSGNTVMSVTEDRAGRVWLGINGGGLNCWQTGKFARVTEPPRLRRHALVYSVLSDREDGLWIGLYSRGILRLHEGVVTGYTVDEGFAPATAWVIFEDRTGAIWLGSERGVQRYQAGRFTRYTRQEGLSHEDVNAFAEDRSGTLYVGTSGGGLNYYRAGRFGCYTVRDGLGDNYIRALYVDGEDTLWIGTANGGLSRFKQGRFVNITADDGLPSNTIGTILEDDLGYLWFGSNRGIIRLSRQGLNEYVEGRSRRLTCDVFNRSDGLSTIACAGGGQPAALKARDGRLWFSTVKGVAVVDPQHLPVNPLPPPVLIEEIVVDDKVHDLQHHDAIPEGPNKAQPVIPPGSHRLEFRFTGLSLVAPEKVRFRYRLEGYDRDWIEGGTQRAVHYTDVPAGHYLFHVTACNNDGIWNPTGATMGIIVLPEWWQTWWFRTIALAGMAGLAFWLVEARVRRVKREHAAQRALSRRLIETQESERKRIAAELHDSLGQNLLVIKNRALLGLQEPAATSKSTEQFDEISRMASTSLAEVREISHDLRPYQLDRLGLTKAIQAMITSVSTSSRVRCVSHFDSLDELLEPSTEIHCYRIVQELLNNIVKHSRASEARISAKVRDAIIYLVVEDDGCGFNPSAVHERAAGVGLTDIAERVRILGGTFHCDSQPTKGTCWRIEIPAQARCSL